MNSDERMHERLTGAGVRWREANAGTARVDLAAITTPDHGESLVPITRAGTEGPRRPHRGRVRMLLAAAVGVAAAASVAVVVVNLGGTQHERPATETGRSLTNTSWTLTGMRRADGTPLQVVAPAPLKFTKDTVSGSDACNSIRGRVTIRAGEVVLGPLVSTGMGCIDRPAGFDAEVSQIQAVLGGTVQWSITGDVLTLTKPGAGALVYGNEKPTKTTDPAVLVGRTWQLALITQGSTSASPDGTASATSATAMVTLAFSKDGGLTVAHRCYEISADVSPADATLRLSSEKTIEHSCPALTDAAARKAAQAEDALVDSILGGTPSWYVDNGQLTIGDTLVFKTVSTTPASCAGDGSTHRFTIGNGSAAAGGTVPVGTVVAVTAASGAHSMTPPKTSSTALTTLCTTSAGNAQTTYFRADHAGTADVISAITDCPSCAPSTFVAHITVLNAPDTGGGGRSSGAVGGPAGPAPAGQ